MIGRLERAEPLFYTVQLDEIVPSDHLLRRVDRLLDFSPLVAELRPHYASTARPSVDPELMLRMLLVGYLYGVRSERRLVEEVRLNLAFRWFCGLFLDSAVPDASTFSKNRHGRFRNLPIFRRMFEQVVDLCIAAGHAAGATVSVDGSFVAADACATRRVDGDRIPGSWQQMPQAQPHPVRAYLADLDAAAGLAEDDQDKAASFTPKHLSLTDPQAAWSRVRNVGQFGYKAHFLIDNAHGIILQAESTDSRLSNEIVAARSMLERQQAKRDMTPSLLAADKSYGTGQFLGWLTERGIEPMVPVLDRTAQTNGKLSRESFSYDPVRVARKIERHWDEAVRDHVRLLAKTAAYAAAARARRKVEARFAQMKRTIGLERLRLRSLKRRARAGPPCSHCHQPQEPGQAQRSLARRRSA